MNIDKQTEEVITDNEIKSNNVEFKRNKEIAEFADDVRRTRESYFGQADYLFAMKLYDDGYRKASDVAEDIIRMLRAAGINEWRYPIVADIKKKYTGEVK